MNRSQILSLLLVVGIVAVVTKTYLLWQEGPWEIPQPNKEKTAAAVVEEKKEPLSLQLAMTTKNVIDNDLFDPERGTDKNKENEAVALARQKIQGMILIGTLIIGESRYALFQDSSDSPSANPSSKANGSVLRLTLGDTIEDFQLSQIEDRKVAFNNGTTNVVVALDFFRKVDGISGVVGPPEAIFQSSPPAPRRDRLPSPPRL